VEVKDHDLLAEEVRHRIREQRRERGQRNIELLFGFEQDDR
jgi:hypothetical protein